MTEIPRLNGAIKALEAGKHAFVTFAQPDVSTAIALSDKPYDAVVFEMEHNPYDIRALRDCLQYMLNRRQILDMGSISPAITPFVRIPPNGGEYNQWIAKQVLDTGVYGVIWPHVSTVQEALNAVAACRYPRPESAAHYAPAGLRGDAPSVAARYWGVPEQVYRQRADVWPLAPAGEVLVVIMVEDTLAIQNLPSILEQVPGIGVVLIGEGDLSQDLGYPRQYEHPTVVAAMREVLAICRAYNMPCGHPHTSLQNLDWVLAEGFRWLMVSPETSFKGLEAGRKVTGRL